MIRDVQPNDKIVFLKMAESHYSSTAVMYNIENHILEATFNAAVSKSPFIRALIIEADKIPAGFALLSFSYATEVGGLVVLLDDLYISEIYRSQGLGSEFMQFMENEYPEAKRFRLEVTKTNIKAIDLYRKLGYKILDYVQMVKDI